MNCSPIRFSGDLVGGRQHVPKAKAILLMSFVKDVFYFMQPEESLSFVWNNCSTCTFSYYSSCNI